jgi:alpha-tubulin suppressor-like RCC1 family protein
MKFFSQRKMFFSVGAIGVFLFTLTFFFQNCAPMEATKDGAFSDLSSIDPGGEELPPEPSALATAVAVGDQHKCAVVMGGVRCWGSNQYGQIGNGGPTGFGAYQDVPALVTGLESGVEALAIDAGEASTCAIKAGNVYCWGRKGPAANNAAFDATPVVIQGLPNGVVESISVGSTHACAAAGGVGYCWGDNTYSQLGVAPGMASVTTAAPIMTTDLIESVSAIWEHTCYVTKTDGFLNCWGRNHKFQVGTNSSAVVITTPQRIPTQGVRSVSGGEGHTCFHVNTRVQCWGENLDGQMGSGAFSAATRRSGESIASLTAVTNLFSGRNHNCAIQNGALKCWGRGSNGQLATGLVANAAAPADATAFLPGVLSVGLGSTSTCAVHADGRVRCVGQNVKGLFQNNTLGDSLTPVAVYFQPSP